MIGLGEIKRGTAVEVDACSGPSRFGESGWSPWRRLGGLRATLRDLAGRYLQPRVTLRGAAPNGRPALTGIKLRPTVAAQGKRD